MIPLGRIIADPNSFVNELRRRFRDPQLVQQILNTHLELKPLQAELETWRAQKNQFNTTVLKLEGQEKQEKIGEMKLVANKIQSLEEETKVLNLKIQELLNQIPNLTWEDMPIAPDSDGNVEIAQYGHKPEFDFEPKNYYDLPVFLRDYNGLKGVEASGFRGCYIQGDLALLQKVLFDWALNRLIKKGFNYIIPPVFVQDEVMYGTGFFPTGIEDTYEVKSGERSFWLTGTSEAALMFYHSNQTLDLAEPIKLTAWTRCFRKEAGSYGKDTKGGIRVNQFEKIETVFICKPQDGERVFEDMTNIFRETVDLLELSYHELEVCTGDVSNKNHRQIDIEAWFPVQNTYRELCSASNCTDYQTHTLNIKCKNEDGSTQLAHSLNCTGMVNRTLFAIMEQFQQADGRVKVPKVLVPFFGKEFLE